MEKSEVFKYWDTIFSISPEAYLDFCGKHDPTVMGEQAISYFDDMEVFLTELEENEIFEFAIDYLNEHKLD